MRLIYDFSNVSFQVKPRLIHDFSNVPFQVKPFSEVGDNRVFQARESISR